MQSKPLQTDEPDKERARFLSKAQYLKDTGALTPGKLARLQPESRLNLIFDIDHTLIFAIDKKLHPRLLECHNSKWSQNIHKLTLCKSKNN